MEDTVGWSANMATASSAGRRARPLPPAGTLVLLVRHGVTPSTGRVLPGRAPGLHLAEEGRAQAEAVAERLAAWAGHGNRPTPPSGREGRAGPPPTDGPPIAAVYASPLARTRETAAPIARRLGLDVTVSRGLLECDFGDWTGSELKALQKLPEWSTVQRYPSGFRFPGGESFTGMRARLAETVAALCRQHPRQAVVAVSHADPIKAVVADALGTHLDLFQRIVVSPCSVTAISYLPNGPVVLAVNSTGSLSELKPS
jgi:probable phosphomutase (TIGR03848 family)